MRLSTCLFGAAALAFSAAASEEIKLIIEHDPEPADSAAALRIGP